jgi:hypothetical protein
MFFQAVVCKLFGYLFFPITCVSVLLMSYFKSRTLSIPFKKVGKNIIPVKHVWMYYLLHTFHSYTKHCSHMGSIHALYSGGPKFKF